MKYNMTVWNLAENENNFATAIKVFHPKLNLYHNELIFCVMHLQLSCGLVLKVREFLPSRFFHESDENCVFSQFESFEFIFLNHGNTPPNINKP